MKHAALCQTQDHLYHLYFDSKTHPINAPAYIEQWLPILAEHGIDVLWVLPDTEMSRHISWRDFDMIDRNRCKVFPDRPDSDDRQPHFVSVRKYSKEFEKDRYFAFPAHGEWNAKENGEWFLPSPYILGQTITYLKKEFGMEPMWGPGNIGMKTLKGTLSQSIENTILTDHLRDIINGAMFRPVWKRFYGLSDEQKTMRYLHGYDKNGQYLGAAQSAFLGIGTPKRVAGPPEVNLGLIGFWRYQITDVSETEHDGYELPCPLDINRQWASGDLLLAARLAGVEFDILEGYVWPTGAKFLEKWAKEMWTHRMNLRDNTEAYPGEIARENALGTAKLAANMMMGRLAKQGSKELYRPDWNMLIVHKAIANQMFSLRKWNSRHGIKPVLVTTDSFWIASDEPDPALAIPDILEYQTEQRGYKHIGRLDMSDEIVESFEKYSPDAVNGILKKKVEEGTYVESV